MIKLDSGNKICRVLEIVVLLAVLVLVVVFADHEYWALFLLLLVSLAALVFFVEYCNRLAAKERKSRAELQERRLLLFRKLVDHSYEQQGNTAVFYKKFCEEINIRNLRKYQLIDRELKVPTGSVGFGESGKLSSEDYEFLHLARAGFTNRELSMIFGLTNSQSVYVKRHRIKAKLGTGSVPAVMAEALKAKEEVRQREKASDLINVVS